MEDPSDCNSGPCLPAVIGIAADIAAGMAFLHGRNILHGDLTCSARPADLFELAFGWVRVSGYC